MISGKIQNAKTKLITGQAVYDPVANQLGEFGDEALAARPFTGRVEVLSGLRPWPEKK